MLAALVLDGPSWWHQFGLLKRLLQVINGDAWIDWSVWCFPIRVQPVDVELVQGDQSFQLEVGVCLLSN